MSPSKIGPYQIAGRLGAGGMGEVYRAHDTKLDRDVAVKILPVHLSNDPAALARFEREAKAIAALSHPNILAIYDFGTDAGTTYAVTELLDGTTLRDRMGEGALPIRQALDYAAQIADGLAAAHAKGLVHRDLKPENVFVTTDGRVKILDFGLVRHLPASDEITVGPTRQTAPGTILGTVGYMSPEQAAGRAVDFQSDQFSFGSVLYEALTGRRAFERSSGPETLSAIIRDEPEPVATVNLSVPAPLRWIVERCLAKDPAERYASTRDLARDLRTLRDRLSETSAVGASPAAAGPRSLRRRILLANTIALAVAMATALVVARWIWSSEAPAQPSFQRLTFRRGEVTAARFGPDGQTVVYSASSGSGPFDVFSTRIGSPDFRSLGLSGGQFHAISSQGEMAVTLDRRWFGPYTSTGTLARVPLAGGAPRQILESVLFADWAPDGNSLAVVHGIQGAQRIEYPIGRILYSSPRGMYSLRISPMGDLVAFIEDEQTFGRFAIGIVDLTGKRRVLSAGWTRAQGLVWSKDGRELWVTATRSGFARALYAITLDGKERRVQGVPGALTIHDIAPDGRMLLTHENTRREMVGMLAGDTSERDLTWLDFSFPVDMSWDGKLLLFNEGGEAGARTRQLWLRTSAGSSPVRLSEGEAGSAISADGKWVMAAKPRPEGLQLELVPAGPGEPRDVPVPGIRVETVSWFPDGQSILVTGNEPGQRVRTYAVPLSGGPPRPLTPEKVGGYVVSPDGQWIFAEDRDAQRFATYPVHGGTPRVIPGKSGNLYPLQWSADGRAVFVSEMGSTGRILRLDLVTGQASLWKDVAPADRAGLRIVQPLVITPDGRFYAYTYVRVLSDLYLVDGLR